MSGRSRIIRGEVSLGGLRGKALSDKLAKEMLQDEKTATYQHKHIKDEHKKMAI